MRTIRGFVITATVLAVVFVMLGMVANVLRELGGDEDPHLYYRNLDGDLLTDYRGVAVVAHNSGNVNATLHSAQGAGAPIVEIDVRTIDNQLYAAHSAPAPIVGRYLTQSVPLATAWGSSSDSPAVILDLKDSSDTFLKRLFTFIEANHDDRRLIISSRSSYALTAARDALPDATLLYSVSTQAQLDRAMTDSQLISVIDGVTVRAGLLTSADDVAVLKDNGLLVYVWVVNNLDDLNRFVEWGVDAVTTDNLAIVGLLAPNVAPDLHQVADAIAQP